MPDNIIINPITRISGFMEIEAEVENGSVADARIKGMMLRNFEKMMVGRNPFDAVYFTQRICGICSSAHAMASTLALENMMGITPSGQGRYLRDIIHGCEYIQNHIRHFYQLIVPDYVKMPDDFPLFTTGQPDYRLPAEKNAVIVNNYFSSLDISRDAHVMLATLGGKAPHNHGVFIGGLTTQATADKIIQLKSILSRIGTFVNEKMIPDVYEIASYYPDYFNIGGGYGNLLTYGCFDNYADLGTLYVNPLVYANRQISAFDSANITLQTDYSRYDDMTGEPDTAKETAYSWIKAPRYDGLAFETGPLARQWLSGEYRNGISVMDRTIARVLETKKIAGILDILLQNLIPGYNTQREYEVPASGFGQGLIDTTRGALGHWINVENNVISAYTIITPSAWNLSPQTGSAGNIIKGAAEQALLGTPVADLQFPVEVGRVVRSYDPCVSCATHAYKDGKRYESIRVV